MSKKKGLSQNIAATRRKLKVLTSYSEALGNSPKSMKFLACAQIEILNNFLCVKVSLWIKDLHWNTSPYRELQQVTTEYFDVISHSNCFPAWWQLYFFLTFGMSAFKSLQVLSKLNKPKTILKLSDETCCCIPKLLLGWLKLNLN